MDPKPGAPPFAEYNNTQLEALLHNPDLSPAEKERARVELTRRLRDDLLKSAQNVTDSKRRQERRGKVRKTSRWVLLFVLFMMCALSALCVYVLAPSEWITGLSESIRSVLDLLPF